jgi:FkbM family methyltransferase
MREVRGIWVPDGDIHMAEQVMNPGNPLVAGRGTYQRNKYLAAIKHVEGWKHAVDVGANVGLWSRLMVMDFAAVTAIEPIAEHRACFELNVKGARLLPVAVGSEPGQLCIRVPSEHVMSAYVADDGESVDVVTLDSLNLGAIDFLKIDIEGYEYEALVGGEQTIRSARPVIIVEQKPGHAERYGRGQWDAVALLEQWGMREVAILAGDHIMVWH